MKSITVLLKLLMSILCGTTGLVLALPAAPVLAACDGVTVIVDFGSLGGGVASRCVGGDPGSGLGALSGAGFSYAFVPTQPGMVCQINSAPNPCNGAPTDAYWSYWHATSGGSWQYSSQGAGSCNPSPGNAEGWSFGSGGAPSASPPEAPAPQPPPSSDPPPTNPPAESGGGQPGSPGGDSSGDSSQRSDSGSRSPESSETSGSSSADTGTSSDETPSDSTSDKQESMSKKQEESASLVARRNEDISGIHQNTGSLNWIVGALGVLFLVALIIFQRVRRQRL